MSVGRKQDSPLLSGPAVREQWGQRGNNSQHLRGMQLRQYAPQRARFPLAQEGEGSVGERVEEVRDFAGDRP